MCLSLEFWVRQIHHKRIRYVLALCWGYRSIKWIKSNLNNDFSYNVYCWNMTDDCESQKVLSTLFLCPLDGNFFLYKNFQINSISQRLHYCLLSKLILKINFTFFKWSNYIFKLYLFSFPWHGNKCSYIYRNSIKKNILVKK